MKLLASVLMLVLSADCKQHSALTTGALQLKTAQHTTGTESISKTQPRPDASTSITPSDSLEFVGKNYQVKIVEIRPVKPTPETGDWYYRLYILKNSVKVDSVDLLSNGGQNFDVGSIKATPEGFTFKATYGAKLYWNTDVYCQFKNERFYVYRVVKNSLAPEPVKHYYANYPVKPMLPLHKFNLAKYFEANTQQF